MASIAGAERHQQAIIVIQGTHLETIKAIKYENVEEKGKNHAWDQLFEKYKDIIKHLIEYYVRYSRDPGKHNIIIIVWKHSFCSNKYHDLSYYVLRIQRRKR